MGTMARTRSMGWLRLMKARSSGTFMMTWADSTRIDIGMQYRADVRWSSFRNFLEIMLRMQVFGRKEGSRK